MWPPIVSILACFTGKAGDNGCLIQSVFSRLENKSGVVISNTSAFPVHRGYIILIMRGLYIYLVPWGAITQYLCALPTTNAKNSRYTVCDKKYLTAY